MRKNFVCYFWFVGWDCISLGLHFCWSKPNIEIHLPFGFIRIGWVHAFCTPKWGRRNMGDCAGFGYVD